MSNLIVTPRRLVCDLNYRAGAFRVPAEREYEINDLPLLDSARPEPVEGIFGNCADVGALRQAQGERKRLESSALDAQAIS